MGLGRQCVCEVQNSVWEASWILGQTTARGKKKGKLKEDREARLVSAGLNLEMQGNEENHQKHWEDMFQCLLHFIEDTRNEETKDLNDEKKAAWVWNGKVPQNYKTSSGKALGVWVSISVRPRRREQ